MAYVPPGSPFFGLQGRLVAGPVTLNGAADFLNNSVSGSAFLDVVTRGSFAVGPGAIVAGPLDPNIPGAPPWQFVGVANGGGVSFGAEMSLNLGVTFPLPAWLPAVAQSWWQSYQQMVSPLKPLVGADGLVHIPADLALPGPNGTLAPLPPGTSFTAGGYKYVVDPPPDQSQSPSAVPSQDPASQPGNAGTDQPAPAGSGPDSGGAQPQSGTDLSGTAAPPAALAAVGAAGSGAPIDNAGANAGTGTTSTSPATGTDTHPGGAAGTSAVQRSGTSTQGTTTSSGSPSTSPQGTTTSSGSTSTGTQGTTSSASLTTSSSSGTTSPQGTTTSLGSPTTSSGSGTTSTQGTTASASTPSTSTTTSPGSTTTSSGSTTTTSSGRTTTTSSGRTSASSGST